MFAKANNVGDKIFSRNSAGACPNCKGSGVEKIDLAFMDDVEQTCEVCQGSGFDPGILKYYYQNKNIAEVMNLTVEGGRTFFTNHSFIHHFDLLIELGLEYLTLGQRLNSFSGGERQRLKLTQELNAKNNILMLDEPSTGLHPSDINKLMMLINKLVDESNTLLVIEHNMDIIA